MGRRRASPVPGRSDDLEGELPTLCGRARKGQEVVRERDLWASWGKQDEGKTLVPLSALGPAASGLQAETTGTYFKGAFVRHKPIQSHVTAQVTKRGTKKGCGHGHHCRWAPCGRAAGQTWARTHLRAVKAAAPEPGCWAATSASQGGASTGSACAEDTRLRQHEEQGGSSQLRWASRGPRETEWGSGGPEQPNKEAQVQSGN